MLLEEGCEHNDESIVFHLIYQYWTNQGCGRGWISNRVRVRVRVRVLKNPTASASASSNRVRVRQISHFKKF